MLIQRKKLEQKSPRLQIDGIDFFVGGVLYISS